MKNRISYSKIIAGTMTWGSWGKNLSKAEMSGLIDYCVENGITTFDHADIYGGYDNEEAFGNAFFKSEIPRESVQLVTKCGIQYVCKARDNKVKHYDYSKDYIVWSAERSLSKLKTDYLDLFLLHRPSPLMEPDEIAEAILHLQKEGKIREFGVSNFSPSQIALLESVIPVNANQVEFSLTAEKLMFDGTFDDCILHKRTAMAWSPLGSYFRETDKRRKRIKKVLKQFKKKYKADSSQILLAWILRHPSKVHPVVGTTNKDRLKASIRATEIELELEDWFALLVASQGHKVP
ncbi:aldo/keto reductase family oxidoreductase [uncultured Eudoraea sp.]|uniref:aldo/keto reductase n=1 Tax=uncultured Eudoraea sp. TaxID=1035614 RepID=UPI00261B5FDE|nr:aldo/keto reductase [uncultured Eudoraea sp.]